MQLIRGTHLIGFRFQEPAPCLSSAVLGGGFTRAGAIVNMHVEKSYAGMDPAGDIRKAVREMNLPETVVGMMTAVELEHAAYASSGGVHVMTTAGVSNAVAAGLTRPWVGGVGTINVLAFLSGRATEAALAGAAITLTEAKVRALRDAGVVCPETGAPATGTSTDAFAIACRGPGEDLQFLGPATPVGFTLARLVYETVLQSLGHHG